MTLLIAIGGGSFQKNETIQFDKLAITYCKNACPNVLFLPTASNDDQGYAKRFKQYYRSLGCSVEALRLFHTKRTQLEVTDKIKQCDILYIGAGDTTQLMQQLKQWRLIETIQASYKQGMVLIGLSAGANVLFTKGYSETTEGMKFVDGMNIVSGLYCPHYQNANRKTFDEKSKRFELICYPCEDNHAWIIKDDESMYM